MKSILFSLLCGILLISCDQQVRYTQASAEIDAYKAAIAAYEAGDWDGFKAVYADSAKIYRNTDEAYISGDSLVALNVAQLGTYSSYGFVADKGDIEMVVTDDGETWVNFWGVWKGTLAMNNKEYIIPVHTTTRWVDGKIIRDHGYWNTAEIQMDVSALEAAAKAAEEASLSED